MRNTIDLADFGRSAIGFEHLFDLLQNGLDTATADGYPPYNIEKIDDDRYRIVLAVAGFSESELSITQEQNRLTVSGRKSDQPANAGAFLYQGIAARPFIRQFNLADYVRVRVANLVNGLLTIDLERELPEAMKPRRIPIGEQASAQLQRVA